MIAELPDALADALGRVVSDARKDWFKEMERMGAQSRAQVAELHAKIVSMESEHKAQRIAQEAIFSANAAKWAQDVRDAITNVKDGERGPQGEVGERGENGDPGDYGAPGEPGPAGKDGADGLPGEIGSSGEPGKEGPQGRDGRDGLPGVPGDRGLDGKDGQDGLGFDDMTADFDGQRTVTLRFVRGEKVKEFPFSLPIPIDHGIYKEGEDYAKGDGVTYGGSFWLCQKDAPEGKPDAGNGNWRLVTKKGRDGKDGHPGKQGDPGPKGKDGRDLTQLGFDGTKF